MISTIPIRILVLVISLLFLIVCSGLTKAPKSVIKRSIISCWIAGLLAAFGDFLAVHFGFWHYLDQTLLFGLPFDLYIAANLITASCGLLFWYLQKTNHPFFPLFLVSVPILGFVNDWLGNKAVGNILPVWDSQYWFIADITIWVIIWAIMVHVYKKMFKFCA